MRINAFADVCLRALMLLTAAPEGVLTSSREIADAVGVPYNHVSKAVIRLRELGLVDVARGRAGGAAINDAGRKVSVGWVLRQLDERPDVVDCDTLEGGCPMRDGCGLRGALRAAREAFYRELDDVVVSALAAGRNKGPVPVMLLTRQPGEFA